MKAEKGRDKKVPSCKSLLNSKLMNRDSTKVFFFCMLFIYFYLFGFYLELLFVFHVSIFLL